MDTAAAADDTSPPEKAPAIVSGEKRKREMKSPYQKEALEHSYAVEPFPNESMVTELSQKTGLSNKQIKMWFMHKRLKERKPVVNKKAKVEKEGKVVGLKGVKLGRGKSRKAVYEHVPMAPPQLSVYELTVIALMEAQIGEPLREDGPILGFQFDPLPPGAFGAPIDMAPHQKQLTRSYNGYTHERNEAMAIKTGSKVPHDYPLLLEDPSIRTEAHLGLHDIIVSEDPHLSRDKRVFHDDDSSHVERKHKSDEARIQKEVEVYEQCIRKEFEKQDISKRKRDEQMRKEMERLDRERKKEEEKMLREKQREKERLLREQRRETERREKFLQKENQRAEKMRQKEEMRKEKEAAKLEAAKERAKARKIASKNTDLIEDEHLELMGLAASSNGLSSITTLGSDTLQQIDMFKDKLSAFPPQSVQLKRPFASQPWTRSEDNIANFLMVWKFLITFTDILGLWPFTMDEFLQSLHDFDSKLLGEIHVALLKTVIKDIEDVARTSSIPLGANQNIASNGGHPQIIEGAYAWGFNIRSWQNHLNLLTWPEIFRQFALSAGFGPHLKKKTVEHLNFGDDKEGNNNEDIISTLRNGSAAEIAVTLMHEKGYSLGRKSRHRLTPGTLKFAAFHVLCLEGSKGLTILEVAEKIQKFGLRDLTTSKTPEASIGVALSRDTRLFERTAPSTYRVRSPFRKDPSDADTILSVARQKILETQNGLLDLEQADKDVNDANEAEIDEDSESNGDDGAEIDISSTDKKLSKDCHSSKELMNSIESPSLKREKQEVDNNTYSQVVSNAAVVGPDIDESNLGEPWVQALTNGDYSDLSVEERLNSLVSLINVAIEGNSIRVILEERFEAAYALKKQMWADAQLGKRRVKEDNVSKEEPASLISSVSNDENNVNNMKELTNLDSIQPQQYAYAAEKSCSHLKSYVGHKAEQQNEYRCLPLGQDRRYNRYWLFSVSASPNEAGSGRIFFESKDGFWRLIDTEEAFDALLAALDARGIRESHLLFMLQLIEPTFKETIIRNRKQTNPGNLDKSTLKTEITFSDLAECSESFKIDSNRNDTERDAISKRYTAFLNSLWKECYNPSVLRAMKYDKRRCPELLQTCYFCYHCYLSEERHCPSCHRTFKSIYNLDELLLEHVSRCEGMKMIDPDWITDVPIGIQLLKAQLCLIEASIPAEALQPFWNKSYRKSWGVKVHASKSAEELLQLITILEHAIKREYLSLNLETTKKLSDSSPPESFLENDGSISGTIPIPPWVPASSAAVALRLLDLDASIYYIPQEKLRSNKDKEAVDFIKPPSRFSSINNIFNELEPSVTPDQADYRTGRGRVTRGRGSRGRGRGGRDRGRGLRVRQGTSSVAKPEFITQGNLSIYKNGTTTYTKRGRTRGRGIKRGQWGRCSMMPRQTSEGYFGNFGNADVSIKQDSLENSPQCYAENDMGSYAEENENSSRSQSDENGIVSGDEFDEDASNYINSYGWNNPIESLVDDSEEDEDIDGYEIDTSRAQIGHRAMDDDMDEDHFGGNVNGQEEGYSSDYSVSE